jgi:uncharacterized membrane protein
MIRRDAWREYSRGSLWLLPIAAVVLALVLGALLSRVSVAPRSPLAFQGTPDDARALLIGITGTMVTVIALLLGLAVVALQLSSTQFSPRLLRNFLRDRPNQIVLSVFVGTFAYSTGGLFEVGVSAGQRSDEFPRFAVTVAVVLLFLSLALLVFFADHLAHSIQVDHIMRVVERSTLPVIHDLPPATPTTVGSAGSTAATTTLTELTELPAVPSSAVPIPARASGYVQVVHLEQLLTAAAARRVHVRLRPRIGEHVVAGTPLAWMWPAPPEQPASGPEDFGAVLDAAVRIGFERTLEQDPGLGLRQLVDLACKALSPAINDPYTAVQAIERLSVLFTALATRPVGPIVAHHPASAVTVTVPARSFAEHLALGVGLIRRYGAKEPTVVQALLRLLGIVLSAAADGDRWSAIETQAHLLVTAAEREVAEPADLAVVYAEAASLRRDLAARRAGAPAHAVTDLARHPPAPPPT